MRIAMVSEHASPLAALGGADAGGQNVHVGALAEVLVRQGHEVVVHTRRDDPSLPREVVTPGGVVVHHVDAGPATGLAKDELLPWMDRFATVLGERWRQARPDVVHAHFWMSGLASLRAGRPLGVPVLQTFHALGSVKRRHQGDADTSPPQRLEIERRLIAETDHLVATCADEASELEHLGAGSGRISVIPCGVDLDLFAPTGVSAAGPEGDRRRILVIGRLVPRKGVDDVVRAITHLPDVDLVVAGGPPPHDLDGDVDIRRLRETATRHGVADRVHLVGRVRRCDLPALIRSSDAVVSVPIYEPFGMVPLEAMACGVPVVVSAVGGLRESVLDATTGLHVPASDPGALAAALGRIIDDRALAARLGAAGVRRACARYGWDGVAADTAALYEWVVERSTRAAVR